MSDIVDRLLAEFPDIKDAQDGAKEIIRLREREKELMEALKPFAHATVIDLTHNGENFVKAVVINKSDIERAKGFYNNTK